MEAKASLKFARISIRKARTVLNMVRGKNVATALNELRFTRKAAAPLIAKLLDSAIANAQQKNEQVDLDNLYIKLAFADKAPDRFMRRFRPRAQGRATRIVKGVSHLHLVLDERAEA
jgi:large subunit ribosomal protein L22